MHPLMLEFYHFILANIRASYFGAYLLLILAITYFVDVPFLNRYDVVFLAALAYQVIALLFRFETLREFAVIFVFHITATIMELFKTHPAIGSWSYPEVHSTIFAIATVPLFTGFLYSAVGSYISRAIRFLNLSYTRMPAYYHLWAIAVLVYGNFFSHHFFFDIRYLILAYIGAVFYRSVVSFRVYKHVWRIPFLLSALLTAVFIWIAENAGTFLKVWIYPNQSIVWHMVSFEKIISWFLLLMLSFALVTLIYQNRLKTGHGR